MQSNSKNCEIKCKKRASYQVKVSYTDNAANCIVLINCCTETLDYRHNAQLFDYFFRLQKNVCRISPGDHWKKSRAKFICPSLTTMLFNFLSPELLFSNLYILQLALTDVLRLVYSWTFWKVFHSTTSMCIRVIICLSLSSLSFVLQFLQEFLHSWTCASTSFSLFLEVPQLLSNLVQDLFRISCTSTFIEFYAPNR